MQRATWFARYFRPAALLTLLLVALLTVSACAPRAVSGELVQRAAETDNLLELPAVVIDYQTDGSAMIGGRPATDLPVVGPSLAGLKLEPAAVQQMVTTGIQHIQINNAADGLLILVNGKAMPSVGWNGQALTDTGQVLNQFEALASAGAMTSTLVKLLPLIQDLGLGVIVRFPLPEGAEPLPMVAPVEPVRTDSQVASLMQMIPKLALTITYDENGSWQIGGVTEEMAAMLLPNLSPVLSATPETVRAAHALGIQDFGVSTNEDGLFFTINGKALPHLAWGDDRIQNVWGLLKDTGVLAAVLGPELANSTLMPYIESLLPVVTAADLDLTVRFQ